MVGGKSIAAWSQSISDAINPLVAFYDIHGKKREVLFLFVFQTPHGTLYLPTAVVRSWKLSNAGQSLDGWPKIYYLEFLRASDGTLSRWSRLHLQSLAPTNLHWARVVGYGPVSLCVIYKEGLCPSSGDINRLLIIIYKKGNIICDWFTSECLM
jgi:hypothetical protein